MTGGGDLDERNYLATLSEKAAEVGILTDEDLCRIQSEPFALLAYQSDRFACGKRASVPAETAVKLAESVFFAIGVRPKREGIPDRAAIDIRLTV